MPAKPEGAEKVGYVTWDENLGSGFTRHEEYGYVLTDGSAVAIAYENGDEIKRLEMPPGTWERLPQVDSSGGMVRGSGDRLHHDCYCGNYDYRLIGVYC